MIRVPGAWPPRSNPEWGSARPVRRRGAGILRFFEGPTQGMLPPVESPPQVPPPAVRLVGGSYIELRESPEPTVEHFEGLLAGMNGLLEEHGELPVLVDARDGEIPNPRVRLHMRERLIGQGRWRRVAIVSGPDVLRYALLRFSLRVLDVPRARVFRGYDEAVAWMLDD